jgi:hypothetical protein
MKASYSQRTPVIAPMVNRAATTCLKRLNRMRQSVVGRQCWMASSRGSMHG